MTTVKNNTLAMMVKDYPCDYRNFEGIIPSGYGAGTSMLLKELKRWGIFLSRFWVKE